MSEKNAPLRQRRTSGIRLELLESRRVLAVDGVTLGPFLSELSEAHPRVEEIASAIESNLANAMEIDLRSPIADVEFETPLEVDVFVIQTPALSPQATGNGSVFVSSFAYSTGAPSIIVVANAEGEATNASISLFPGLGITEIEVQPESTYYIGVGQAEGIEGFPLVPTDSVGPYQLDVSYFEPLPTPPEPVDVEPNSIADALPIQGGIATGFLQAGDDVDYFKVTASSDGTLRFFLDAAPFVGTELRLEDADGQLLASEVAMFGPVEFALDVFANDTYYISLRGEDASGSYNLFVNEEVFVEFQPPTDRHGDTMEDATDVTEFGPFWLETGLINSLDDVDWFRIDNSDGATSSQLQFTPNESVLAELVSANGTVLHTFSADNPLVQEAHDGGLYLRVTAVEETNVGYDFLLLQADAAGDFELGFDPDFGVVDPPTPTEPSDPVEPGSDVPPTMTPTQDLVGDDYETAMPLAGLDEIGIPGLFVGQGALNGFTDFGVLDIDVFTAEIPEGVTTVSVSTPNSQADDAIAVSVVDADGVLLLEGSANEPMDLAVNFSTQLFVSVTSQSELFVNYDVSVWSEVPMPEQPNSPTPEPSLEELAEVLGFSVEELLREIASANGADELPSEPFQPVELTWEELAELLGISDAESPEEELVDQVFIDPSLEELGPGPSEDPDASTVRAGDIDLDNRVGFTDFLIMSEYYGTETGAEWQHGNFDGDGDVDFSDFLQLSSAYGT